MTDEGNSSTSIAVMLSLSFRKLCLAAILLPLITLLICLITAYIFQPDDIHETHCQVYNIIPSISAITGVSPQRYLWRFCIAFHCGPRLIMTAVYYAHYLSLVQQRPLPEQSRLLKYLRVCYWLSMVEVGTLCGVTYISNRENYPAHEKIFIGYMISSLSYMLVVLRLVRSIKPEMTVMEFNSYRIKKALFAISIVSTVGLILFFLKHRFLCHDMAFSWFALCEYIIASCNMAFHATVILDFPSEEIVITTDINAHLSSEQTLNINTYHADQKKNE